jgi:hypothetical protein
MPYLESDLAYAAGVLDSDGCICVSRPRKTSSNKWNYSITVAVQQVDDGIPLWLASTFGGKVTSKRQFKPGKIYRPLYSWYLYCKNASVFLQAILPYLKLKRYRAELAIKLQNLYGPRGGFRSKGYAGVLPIPKENLEERARIAELIRRENMRLNARVAMRSTWGVN